MKNKSVLVVAAHPDDEILGCGGAICRHARQGDEVNVVIVAEGIASRTGETKVSEEISRLTIAAKEANAILGAKSTTLLGLPDNKLDSLARLTITQKMESLFSSFNPQIVYTHHWGDLNVDHRRVCEAVMTALRPLPNSNVEKILTFEVMSSTAWGPGLQSTSFVPNLFIDIENELSSKLSALKKYESEMRPFPHARSYEAIEALAKYRGSLVGLNAAEAFVIAREVVPYQGDGK